MAQVGRARVSARVPDSGVLLCGCGRGAEMRAGGACRLARAGEDGAVSHWARSLSVGTCVCLHVRREGTGWRRGVSAPGLGRLWSRPLCRPFRGVSCLAARLIACAGCELRLGG